MNAKKLKVLHILYEIKFSGAEVMLNLASDYLQKKGISLYALNTSNKLGDYADVMQKSGYQIFHIPISNRLKFIIHFYSFLKKEKFDVVHIHPEKYKLLIALIAKLASVGIITTTVHSVFGGLFKGAKLRNFKIKRWIARNILGVTFIAISPSVKEIEEEILSNPTELVPNWTDETKFFPAKSEEEKQMLRKELGIHENSLVIISVGSCIPIKNQKDIITCTHQLISKNYNIIYLLVGDGPLRQSYEEYAKQLGIEQYVRFVGQSNKVRDLLIASDVFVMTSKYEGLGNSLLEALYCGLPAIVYNVYGLRDLVEDSKNGFVIETNPDMLADKLEILYNNEILRKQFGANGYEYVKKEYNMKTSLDKMIQVYEGKK